MNNDDLKEEIKNRIKLSEIISKKVILKKKSDQCENSPHVDLG